MTCRAFVEFLAEHFSRELSAEERAAFDGHLAVCGACVAYLKTYEDTIRLGKAAFDHPDDPVPQDVPEELVRAILAARAARK